MTEASRSRAKNISESNSSGKRVAFGATADTVHPVIPKKSELTEEDINLLWYTSSDLDAAKRDILVTLAILRSRPFSSSSSSKNNGKNGDVCARGLEMQTDRVRKFDALKASNAMLEEQTRQKSLGINDPEALAKAYGAKAVYSQETALRVAREDESEAELALAEMGAPKRGSMLKSLGRALQDMVPTVLTPKSSPAAGAGERKRIQQDSPSAKKGKASLLRDMKVSLSGHKKRHSTGRKRNSTEKPKKKDRLSVSDHIVRKSHSSGGSPSQEVGRKEGLSSSAHAESQFGSRRRS